MPPTSEVSCDELKTKVEGAKFAAAFFGDTSDPGFKAYQEAASDQVVSDKYSLFYVTDVACAHSYNLTKTPGVVLFRNLSSSFEEEPTLIFQGELTSQNFLRWLTSSTFPPVVIFDENMVEPIF
jgi:hypothetical protein